MPSKKKKYNARFPAGRIKKIMQTDEEVGKVAQAVPVIISRTLELFVESLLTKAMEITSAKNAKTLSPSHMKQCILSESRFDFLKDLVKSLPDVTACDSEDGTVQPNASSQPSNSVGRPDAASAGIRKSQEGYSLTGVREDRSPAAVGTPQPTPVISNRVTPNFYKENDEGTAVQSAPETLEIDDDSEDEGAEIRTPTIAPQYIPPPQISSIVDEDYDT